MGRRYARKTGQRPQDERDLSIRADLRDPADLDKLCELLIRMALTREVRAGPPQSSTHPRPNGALPRPSQ